MAKDDTFITKRITNQDIYDSLHAIKQDICEFKTENRNQQEEMIRHQIKTNGRVSINRWIANTALGAIGAITAWMFFIVSKLNLK